MERLNESDWSQRFLQDIHLQRPAILRGWESRALTVLRERLHREELLAKHGDHEVLVGTVVENVEARSRGAAQQQRNLSSFILSGMRDAFLFDQGQFLRSTDGDVDWELPPGLSATGSYVSWAEDERGPRLTLALGGDGQGINFHTHVDAYNVQLFGSKRWAIYAPHAMRGADWSPTEPMVTWLTTRRTAEGYPQPTWECIQEEGDLLYIPEGFHHATASLGESVGVVQQAWWMSNSTSWFHFYEGGFYHGHAESSLKAHHLQKQALLRRAVEIDSSHPEIWVALSKNVQVHAEAEGVAAEWHEAAGYLREARDINPGLLQYHQDVFDILSHLGRMEEARAAAVFAVAHGHFEGCEWLDRLAGQGQSTGTNLQEVSLPEDAVFERLCRVPGRSALSPDGV
jgi:hypothetical protein